MSAIFIGFILLSRILLMILKLFWVFLWPLILIALIVVIYRWYKNKLEEDRCCSYYRFDNKLPTDERDYIDLTRNDVHK